MTGLILACGGGAILLILMVLPILWLAGVMLLMTVVGVATALVARRTDNRVAVRAPLALVSAGLGVLHAPLFNEWHPYLVVHVLVVAGAIVGTACYWLPKRDRCFWLQWMQASALVCSEMLALQHFLTGFVLFLAALAWMTLPPRATGITSQRIPRSKYSGTDRQDLVVKREHRQAHESHAMVRP